MSASPTKRTGDRAMDYAIAYGFPVDQLFVTTPAIVQGHPCSLLQEVDVPGISRQLPAWPSQASAQRPPRRCDRYPKFASSGQAALKMAFDRMISAIGAQSNCQDLIAAATGGPTNHPQRAY